MPRLLIILFSFILGLASFGVRAEPSQLDLAPHKGKVVYVDFWASWCGPCRESFPWMQAMHEKYKDKGLVIITINLDHERAKADAFLKKFNPTFTQMYDPEGKLADEFKVQTMPYSFVVDRTGAPRAQHFGFFKAKIGAYEKEILALLNEPAPTVSLSPAPIFIEKK